MLFGLSTSKYIRSQSLQVVSRRNFMPATQVRFPPGETTETKRTDQTKKSALNELDLEGVQ